MINPKPNKPLVLVLEDQPDTMFAIKKALRTDFDITEASLISDAAKLIKTNNFDAFILDLDLPDGSSFDLIEQMKTDAKNNLKPVLILTASSDVEDIVLGFNLGIDDFVSKPFNCFELNARLRNRLQKSSTTNRASDIILINDCFSIKTKEFEAVISLKSLQKEKIVKLTKAELKILETLYNCSPNHVSRQKLCDVISTTESFDYRKVDQHIKNLRQKISPVSVIKSSYGYGYYLDARTD